MTGCMLTTTSPDRWTMGATSIQPPARLMSTPLTGSFTGVPRGN